MPPLAPSSTLYRFDVDLSDTDRGLYERLELRVAMHPSESPAYLLTRVLAYLLCYAPGLEFSSGLSTPDEPALRLCDLSGAALLHVLIGEPGEDQLLKSSKASERVRVYTYKDPAKLRRSVAPRTARRLTNVECFAFEGDFLGQLEGTLERRNAWAVMISEGTIYVTAGETSVEGAALPFALTGEAR